MRRPDRPLVIAHRGGAYPDLPGEQTTAHFERAVALGADYIEVDLRETADGRIVCVHDPDHAGRPVAATRFAELVAASDAARTAPPALLSELMEIARGRAGLDLELKAGGFEDRVLAQVSAAFPPDDVIYKSFRDAVVLRLKELAPRCTAGLLLGVERPRLGAWTRATELFPEARLWRCRADFVSPHHRLVRLGFARRTQRLGWPVLVWTVNDPQLAAWALSHVDGVITDRPELCLRLRSGAGGGDPDAVAPVSGRA